MINGTLLSDYRGGTFGCDDASWEFTPLDEIWISTPFDASSRETVLTVMGHVPATAAKVEVTLDDGSVVRTDVQTDGYFMEVIHRLGTDVSPQNLQESGSPPDIPGAVSITALDDDGNVVAQQDLG